MSDITDRIRRLRKVHGWTQGTLAEKILGSELDGVGSEERANMVRSVQSKISVWERGKFEPSLSSLIELTGIFGVTLEWLATGKEAESPISESLDTRLEILVQHLELLRVYRNYFLNQIHHLFNHMEQQLLLGEATTSTADDGRA